MFWHFNAVDIIKLNVEEMILSGGFPTDDFLLGLLRQNDGTQHCIGLKIKSSFQFWVIPSAFLGSKVLILLIQDIVEIQMIVFVFSQQFFTIHCISCSKL